MLDNVAMYFILTRICFYLHKDTTKTLSSISLPSATSLLETQTQTLPTEQDSPVVPDFFVCQPSLHPGLPKVPSDISVLPAELTFGCKTALVPQRTDLCESVTVAVSQKFESVQISCLLPNDDRYRMFLTPETCSLKQVVDILQ